MSAGVSAPTLYHHFGDKDGLVAAVLARTATAFAGTPASADPADGFRRGWDLWTGFAIAHPALFVLAMRRPEDVLNAIAGTDARLGDTLLALRAAGRLKIPVAVAFAGVRAAAHGVAALLAEGTDADDVRRASAALRDATASAWIGP